MKALCSIEGCERASRKLGYCAMHYHRWWRHGDPYVTTRAANGTPLAWLEAHISHVGEECLIWPFHRDGRGRARVDVDRHQKSAAQVMCEKAHGPAPSPRHQAAHSCGKGHFGCIHPGHLSWKTPEANQGDRVEHGTWFNPHPVNNTSGRAGVGWHKKTGQWRAYISENNQHIHLGFFATFDEAVAARKRAEKKRRESGAGWSPKDDDRANFEETQA